MIVRLNYNNKLKNIFVVFIIIIYIMFLQFTDKNNGATIILMTFIQIGIVLFISISRLFNQKNVLDPCVWFPPIFTLVNSISCIFAFMDSNMLSFEPYKEIFQRQARFILVLNAVALIAFYLGNIILIKKNKKNNISKQNLPPTHYRTLIFRTFNLILLIILLYYYLIFTSGGLEIIAQNRGVDQFSGYGGLSYLFRILINLLYFSVISFAIPLLFAANKKRYFIIFFVLIGIYLFPSIYVGTRSPTVFFVIVLLLNYFVYHKNPDKLINIKTFLLSILTFAFLIFFFGFIRNIQGESFSVYLLNFFTEIQLSSGVGMMTVHYFPDHHSYYFGGTYISAFFNLIPNILFGGARPFVNPSLVFHELFAPDVTDLGFGFSMFAEAYMNGGAISVFLFFFFFSIFLNYIFLNPQKNIFRMAMISLVFLSTMWFLRGDSTSYVKTIIFGFLLFKFINYRFNKIII